MATKHHDDDDTPETRLARLILALRSQGVIEPAVLNAIETTPRPLFTQELFKERAFEDSALPIACGQTISQPYVVAYMTEQLRTHPRHRALEIGTGSGYQAAVLSRLCRKVVTVERYRTLVDAAQQRFASLGYDNIQVVFGDGYDFAETHGTFDRIQATGAEVIQEPIDQPYGVRDCAFRDPAGNHVRINQA